MHTPGAPCAHRCWLSAPTSGKELEELVHAGVNRKLRIARQWWWQLDVARGHLGIQYREVLGWGGILYNFCSLVLDLVSLILSKELVTGSQVLKWQLGYYR
jgi:hypothetical protein